MRFHQWLNSAGVAFAILIGFSSNFIERTGVVAIDISDNQAGLIPAPATDYTENETGEYSWLPKIILHNEGDSAVTVRYAEITGPIVQGYGCETGKHFPLPKVNPYSLQSGAQKIVTFSGELKYKIYLKSLGAFDKFPESCFHYSIVDKFGGEYEGIISFSPPFKDGKFSRFVAPRSRCLTVPIVACF